MLGFAAPAYAQSASPASDSAQSADQEFSDVIIVTAQKREQSVNTVGMSITAATGDQLKAQGVTDVRDLAKVVNGFTYTDSFQATPVFVLRGIGLMDSGLSSVPSVAVYVDQVSLPYPVMTQAIGLDLERVEVLKGPQGTLFGQNSTGGAINYIAAKPTEDFHYGLDASVNNYGETDVSGYISGPLGDGLRARVAGRSVQGGAWQKNVFVPTVPLTNGTAKLGDKRKLQGRLSLEAEPTSTIDLALTITGWQDKSDNQAGQLLDLWIGGQPSDPGLPNLIGGANDPLLSQPLSGLSGNPKLAGFLPGYPNRQDSWFWQAAFRADVHFTDLLTLTSISAYSDVDYDSYFQADASTIRNLELRQFGRIKHFSQELRLAYDTDRFHGVVGGTYDRSNAKDSIQYEFENASAAGGSVNFPFFLPDRLGFVESSADQIHKTIAAFAHAEYNFSDALTVLGGIRFTNAKIDAVNCSRDLSDNQGTTAFFSVLSGFPLAPGTCYPIALDPTQAPGPLSQKLDEDSTSFNIGVNYTLPNSTLLYASFSRGYKGGVVPNLAAALQASFAPATQERLDSYEVGVKAPLMDGRLQVNAAAFYYDYTDKQIRGQILDPNFGQLEKIVNVPKSRVIGQELSVIARPADGLRLTGGVTHIDTKITSDFFTFSALGEGNVRGSRLNFAPEWTGNGDAEYRWGVSSRMDAFAGASVTFRSLDRPIFQFQNQAPLPMFDLNPYALIDLRAGVETNDGDWRFELFGRNVTNKYYRILTYISTDTLVTFVGRPATWGARMSYRY